MRHAIVLTLGLALTPSACSHAVGGSDPTPPATAAALVNTAGAPTAAAVIYRVPIEGLPSFGNPNAPVTIVAFTDYQCPFCRRAETTLEGLKASYGDQVRFVIVEKPLPMHARARPAAAAALAADAQGAFEAMHGRLFQGDLDDASLEAAAKALKLDLVRFDADRLALAPAALAKSEALADRLGVTGTPSFFINGREVMGAQPIDTFREVIDERLTAARTLMASGVRSDEVYARSIAGGAEKVANAEEPGGACGEGADCKGRENEPDVGDKVETIPLQGAPARGAVSAPITIVEFADYQCPFCARAEASLHAVEQAHPGEVRIVWKNLPLPFHDRARAMARAAVAADQQGHFWEMHDRLFALQGGTADRAAFDGIARDLHLDLTRFDRDLDDPSLDARIDADDAEAKGLGVSGTPTFFVNGHRVVGAQPMATFERAIAKK